MSKEIVSALSSAAELFAGVAPVGGPIGIVAGVSAVALKAASAIAAAGGEPIKEISRMLSAHPEVTAVEDEWSRVIADRFPTSEPPKAGDGSDVYGDDDGQQEDQPP